MRFLAFFAPCASGLALLALGLPPALYAAAATPDVVTPGRNLVQQVSLDPLQPCFVPTHPRVTTTLRFPAPIGAPEGRGFIEDEKKQVGEYLVAWTRGDAHLTLSPLPGAGPLNLNIPFAGTTYVFYFYPVEHQFQAVAGLTLVATAFPEGNAPAATGATARPIATRVPTPLPPPARLPVTPARLVGLADRLKLLLAATSAPELLQRAGAMRLEVRSALVAPASGVPGDKALPAEDPWRERPQGLFTLRLRLLAADRPLGCVAIAVEVTNVSAQALGFNPTGFAARLGPRFLPAVLGEGPAILAPGESRPGFFIVRLPEDLPAHLDNAWQVSFELIAPRLNPGAALGTAFLRAATQPRPPGGSPKS